MVGFYDIRKWSLVHKKMKDFDFSEYGFTLDKEYSLWTKGNYTIYIGAGISEDRLRPVTMLSLVTNYTKKDEELLVRGKENIIEYLNGLRKEIRNKNLDNLLNGESL